MKEAKFEPYWGLFRGVESKYSSLFLAKDLIDVFVYEGKALRQYDIFGDSTIWFPGVAKEIEDKKQAQIKKYTDEINKGLLL